MGDARIAPRGKDQADGGADRLADENRVVQVELLKQGFDGVAEVAGRVIDPRGGRFAMPGQVDRDHLGLRGVQPLDDLEKHVKLRAQRVNEHDRSPRAGAQVADVAAVDGGPVDVCWQVPTRRLGHGCLEQLASQSVTALAGSPSAGPAYDAGASERTRWYGRSP